MAWHHQRTTPGAVENLLDPLKGIGMHLHMEQQRGNSTLVARLVAEHLFQWALRADPVLQVLAETIVRQGGRAIETLVLDRWEFGLENHYKGDAAIRARVDKAELLVCYKTRRRCAALGEDG